MLKPVLMRKLPMDLAPQDMLYDLSKTLFCEVEKPSKAPHKHWFSPNQINFNHLYFNLRTKIANASTSVITFAKITGIAKIKNP